MVVLSDPFVGDEAAVLDWLHIDERLAGVLHDAASELAVDARRFEMVDARDLRGIQVSGRQASDVALEPRPDDVPAARPPLDPVPLEVGERGLAHAHVQGLGGDLIGKHVTLDLPGLPRVLDQPFVLLRRVAHGAMVVEANVVG